MTELEKMFDKYQEHFEKPYPLVISSGMTDEEIMDEIEECINTDTPAEEPDFSEGDDY